ncbi:MAG: flagellar biosynthesis protein FlhB [Nitrospinae bacterium CG11_big_fil_rev_8_21_14_0_20_56_8]|nr:MAG: flagellar biosynthesis protein FlhB [Nitrospinae bacterium CG11_big_fil_rev_8_21_14_0_20_56_8]
MAEENKDQKTEDPTSKRITDAEEKGNFAHSREITSSFILLGAVTIFAAAGADLTQRMLLSWRHIFTEAAFIQLSVEELYRLLQWVMEKIFLILGPVLLTIMIMGVLSNLFQTGGFQFSMHPLAPKFSKLNPIKGVARIFSKNALMELAKSLFKISVVSYIAFQTIRGHWDEIPPLMGFGVGQILVFMGDVALEIMLKVFLVMLFLALLDYLFQKFTYMENLRMTKQEIKDERKEMDGNPQIKQRIRTVQLEMTRKRMMAAVPHADVVVTNPTHLSIAIKYDLDKATAPAVVAKGQGEIAMRIREIARANGVPLVEDKPLARVLFQTVEVGQLIPASLYKAVAEILAYVYRLRGKVPV